MHSNQPTESEGIGYSLADLEAFLIAAERRVDELQSEISRIRTPRSVSADDAGAESRAQIAEVWMSAHLEAETIRAAADQEALDIITAARAEVSSHSDHPAPDSVSLSGPSTQLSGLELLKTTLGTDPVPANIWERS